MAVWGFAKQRAHSPHSHPWLAAALFAFDRLLLRQGAVVEYTAHPACVFRLEIARARRQLTLSDGTQLRAGQRIAQLHIWNEHVPPVTQSGATIGWARQVQQILAISLRELAQFLSSRPDLDDISVICAEVPSGTEAQSQQVAFIMAHYGFESIIVQEPLSIGQRVHRFGGNILISLIVFAQNARALRLDTLRRVRVPIYLSRATLQRKFGAAEEAVLVGDKAP